VRQRWRHQNHIHGHLDERLAHDAIEHMRSAATALPARLSTAALDVQSPVPPAAVNTPAHPTETSVTSPWTRHLYPTAATGAV
jgi:hypothetical protein